MTDDFFDQKEIKKLRRIAGGDTYVIIYLKMLLLSLRDEGKLYYDGLEATFAEELALTLDEDVDNVKMTVSYLINTGLMTEVNEIEAELTHLPSMIGKEGASAERVRRFRQRQKSLQSNGDALQSNIDVTKRNTEIDIETDTELKKSKSGFTPPTREEVRAYFKEKGFIVDPDYFFDYYDSDGWLKGNARNNKKEPMRNWKQTAISWNNREKKNGGGKKQPMPAKSEEENELMDKVLGGYR